MDERGVKVQIWARKKKDVKYYDLASNWKYTVERYYYVWHYTVSYHGKVYLTDNTGSSEVIFRHAEQDYHALRRMVNSGHIRHMKPWNELVEETRW